MYSVILQATTRILVPIQLVLSLIVFLRGHNEPGGGFIAALIAAAAFTLHMIAFGRDSTRRLIRIDPLVLIALGWFSALSSGVVSLFSEIPFMTGVWGGALYVPVVGKVKIGTVLFFDLGVYLLVMGAVLKIVFLADEEK